MGRFTIWLHLKLQAYQTLRKEGPRSRSEKSAVFGRSTRAVASFRQLMMCDKFSQSVSFFAVPPRSFHLRALM